MKRYLAIVLCFVIGCLYLSGCTNPTDSSAQPSVESVSSVSQPTGSEALGFAVTAGSGEDDSLTMRSVKGQIVRVPELPDNYYVRYCSPLDASDYIFFACSSDSSINLGYIYRSNMATREDKLIYEGDLGIDFSTKSMFHPNGTYSIRLGDFVLFFNSTTDELIRTVAEVDEIMYVNVMPDGEHIAYCSADGVCVSNLDFTQTEVICKDEDIIYGARWLTVSNDGRYLEFTSGYDGAEMRRVLCDLQSGENKFIEYESYGRAFWYDGGFVAYHDGSYGGTDPYIRCFDTDANMLRGFDYDITFNPFAVNSKYFLFCDFKLNVICCDIVNGDMFRLDFGEFGACKAMWFGQMISDTSFICTASFDNGEGSVGNLYIFEF